ncbi:hypothetical protein E4U55_003528 [Claviceps digitariae]|nr:hypothetical protein E4U55_003528 [Claviceps digitariae]
MSASLAPECNEVKERYDTCFLKWYSEKYLRGAEKDNQECAALFNDYQKCLGVALKEKGIDKLVDEAREDNKENDMRLTAPKRLDMSYYGSAISVVHLFCMLYAIHLSACLDLSKDDAI